MADATPFDMSQFGDYTSPDELAARQRRLMATSQAFQSIQPGWGSSSGLAALLSGMGSGWGLGGMRSIESDLRGNQASDQALLRRLSDIDGPARGGQTPQPTLPALRSQSPSPASAPQTAAPLTPPPGIALGTAGASAASNTGGQEAIPTASPAPAAAPSMPNATSTAPSLDSPRPGFAQAPTALDSDRERQRRTLLMQVASRPGPTGDMARKELEFDQQKRLLFGLEHEKGQIQKQVAKEASDLQQIEKFNTLLAYEAITPEEHARLVNAVRGNSAGAVPRAPAANSPGGTIAASVSANGPPAPPTQLAAAVTADAKAAGFTADDYARLDPQARQALRMMRVGMLMADPKQAEAAKTFLDHNLSYQTVKKEREQVAEATGKARADLPTALEASDRMVRQIEEVQNSPILSRMTGSIQGALPNVRGDSIALQERINQLSGAAFLQAFNTLRGGGQITEVEGAKATDALARLRNLRQSDSGYVDALRDFKYEVLRLSNLARRKAGQPETPIPAADIVEASNKAKEQGSAASKTEPAATQAAAQAAAAEPQQRNLTAEQIKALDPNTPFDFFMSSGEKKRYIKRPDGRVEEASTGDEAKTALKGVGEDISNSPAAKFVKWLTTKTPDQTTAQPQPAAPPATTPPTEPGSSKDNPLPWRPRMGAALRPHLFISKGGTVFQLDEHGANPVPVS